MTSLLLIAGIAILCGACALAGFAYGRLWEHNRWEQWLHEPPQRIRALLKAALFHAAGRRGELLFSMRERAPFEHQLLQALGADSIDDLDSIEWRERIR